jgi:VIT1/CCC1 family predicted Fe2+/Mn2+ transporter/rubrerythrin
MVDWAATRHSAEPGRVHVPIDTRQSLDNLKLERDAIALYEALARIEKDERRASAFRTIAGNERRHAEIWSTKLREQGVEVPPADGPRPRVRLIITLARVFGTHAVSELVRALEGDEEEAYDAQTSPEVQSIAADERKHAEIWRHLEAERARRPKVEAMADRDGGAAAVLGVRSVGDIARRESWHRAGQSGTLRAVIFGVSDGLVSNLSLVMGVAGASTQSSLILLAGIAGLLAGAFSMAAGEYVSMKSQRELYERQIALERAELEAVPEEEQAELAAVYRSKGFTQEEAARIAERIFRNPEAALETLIREELGLDPDELGSPWGAAGGSFSAFAVGAVIPVIPYLLASGTIAFAGSIVLSAVALFAVGSGVSLLTGRGVWFSGARQVAIGAAAAAVTFLVGHLIGVAVG